MVEDKAVVDAAATSNKLAAGTDNRVCDHWETSALAGQARRKLLSIRIMGGVRW